MVKYGMNSNHHAFGGKEYLGLPLVSGNGEFIEEYLGVLHGVMWKALNQYTRVFAFRFDLHLIEGVDADASTASNAVVTRFFQSLKAKIRHNRCCALSRNGNAHNTVVRYFWVREVGDFGRVHYHCVVLLNANAFNWMGSYYSLGENMANRVWGAWASALEEPIENVKSSVHFPENPAYVIHRNNHKSIREFFHRVSYLCKCRTKQFGYGHHGCGYSRV